MKETSFYKFLALVIAIFALLGSCVCHSADAQTSPTPATSAPTWMTVPWSGNDAPYALQRSITHWSWLLAQLSLVPHMIGPLLLFNPQHFGTDNTAAGL